MNIQTYAPQQTAIFVVDGDMHIMPELSYVTVI